MPLRRDFEKAKRIFRNILRTRRNRQGVSRRRKRFETADPAAIEIVVYFADSAVNLYQLRQWYAPLAELSKYHNVGILARSPGTALKLWKETELPTWSVTHVREIEDFVAHRGIRIVLYVNQNAKNFQMMRYGRMWHVFINHGESDKMYMTSNQFKTYDYALIAGEAARERLRATLWNYDVDTRTLQIGRPQADHFAGTVPYPDDDRTVVLYAPTWEGDRPAAYYGSIVSHGEAIAAAVLASPKHRLVYRPHPRSGVRFSDYRAAHHRIVAAINAANEADPSAVHVYDNGPELGWQLANADVAITDISAMVYDRLATGKPILITRPVHPEADVDERGYLGACEWLTAAKSPRILEEAERVMADESSKARLQFWATKYFGDTTQGVATQRFHAAIEQLLRAWHDEAALHDARSIEVETDDDDDAGHQLASAASADE